MSDKKSDNISLNYLERNFLHASVGEGISTWASMEVALVLIFQTLMNTTPHKAGLVLYSIININIWVTIITELFAQDDQFKDLAGSWNKKAERVKSLNSVRTRLAHHSTDHGKTLLEPPELTPSPLDRRAQSLAHKPLSKREIREFTDKVNALTSDLFDLAVEMDKRRPSPDTPDQPEGDRPEKDGQ